MKKDNKKAMVATWSDSETSKSDSDEEQVANIWLIIKEIRDNEITEHEGSDEVAVSALYKCFKDEVIDALISFANLEQKYLSKYKYLKKNVRELTQENLVFEKLNNDLHDRIETLENKKLELQTKCVSNKK